ncbi:hypothetical protein Y032_0004g2211 [Ancylostoma ceylanicum]|uniref:EGF-like domain-containing protein n=1 Tax=Ancylostoma ceylanicum TaxID=53326 RepID=A0A016VVZ9_9BILA|nr:hypothetical protein Y032_0004g2211 [Ancylostoma ceylanicum]
MRVVIVISFLLLPLVRSEESPFHKVVITDCDLSSMKNDPLSSVYPVDNISAVIIKGTHVLLENCTLHHLRTNDTEDCEELCAPHGRCSLREAGTPIEHYECLCNYGYRGLHCKERIRTKFALMYFVWVCVLIEIVLIWLAVKRYANRRYFVSPLPAQRFVDTMTARAKGPKKLN